jgi:hypothetical protein
MIISPLIPVHADTKIDFLGRSVRAYALWKQIHGAIGAGGRLRNCRISTKREIEEYNQSLHLPACLHVCWATLC